MKFRLTVLESSSIWKSLPLADIFLSYAHISYYYHITASQRNVTHFYLQLTKSLTILLPMLQFSKVLILLASGAVQCLVQEDRVSGLMQVVHAGVGSIRLTRDTCLLTYLLL
jgi:hypothetical protein